MSSKKEVDPKRSRIAKSAKAKGSNAQRDIAKVLGLWYFNDKDVFHSTPSSGGLRWKSKVGGTRGDIVAADGIDWPFSIEVKNQEKSNWDLYSLLTGTGPILKDWWKQCSEDALEVGKNPWLIFTRNNIPYFSIIEQFIIGGGVVYPYMNNFPRRFFSLHYLEQPLVISTLGHLLHTNHRNNSYNSDNHDTKIQKLMNKVIFNVVKD